MTRPDGSSSPPRLHDALPLVVLLDDWQRSALASADWDRLAGRARVRAIARPLPDEEAVVSALRHAAADHSIVVSATRSAPFDAAELAWALILGAYRRIPEQSARLRRGAWTGSLRRSLDGRTLGVVGLGRLGGRVAKVGLAFGMDVVAWSANLTDGRCAEVGVRRASTLESFLSESDVVTIHLRLSDRTRGLIGEAALRRMRPDALLVNTSRGPIVDEGALIRACSEGWIGAADLDVFDEEPLPRDHPFLRLPNVLATPHLGYVADGSWTRWSAEALEDVEAWLDGMPIRVLTPGG